MNKFIAIPLIVLIAGAASANSSPNERFNLALDKIKSFQSQLDKDRQSARQAKDSIKFSCLNDASHQVYAATKQLEGRYFNPSDHDADIAEAILTRVTTISTEASLCQGNTLIAPPHDGTTVTLSIDDTITPVDPSLSNPPLIIDPPNCASCFR